MSVVLDETNMFISMLLHYNLDYKDLRKVLRKISKRAPFYIQNGLMKCLMETKKPKAIINTALEQLDVLPGITRTLVEEGFHGMVMVGDEIFPISLSVDSESKEWCIEEEGTVGLACAHQCMNDLEKNRLSCTVMLFKHLGFKGIPMEFVIARQPPGSKVGKQIKGTQYSY